LKYVDDDGDLITVTNDSEWVDAVKLAALSPRMNGVLLVSVFLSHSQFPACTARVMIAQQPSVVHQASCDACSKQIVGTRYKCGNCSNYDLCAKCEENKELVHDRTHVFLKTTAPIPSGLGTLLPRVLVAAPATATVLEPEALEEYSWFKPTLTREQAELLLSEEEPRTFLVRKTDATSYALSWNDEALGVTCHAPLSSSERGWSVKIDDLQSPFYSMLKKLVASFDPYLNVKSFELPVRFAAQLTRLRAMGFVDRKKNVELLERHNSDLLAVVEELLSGSNRARAMWDYTPDVSNEELGFKAGDVLNIIVEEESGWWKCELNGKSGWAPANFLQKLINNNNNTSAPLLARRIRGDRL